MLPNSWVITWVITCNQFQKHVLSEICPSFHGCRIQINDPPHPPKASYTDNPRGYALSTPKTHQQWWSQTQIWYPPFHQRSSHFQSPKPGDFSSKHFIQCLAGDLGDSACSHGRQAGPSGGGGGGGSSSSSSSGDASSSPLSDAALGAEDETGELDIFGFRPFSLPFLGARKRVANMFIQRYHISQIRWIQTKTIYQNTKLSKRHHLPQNFKPCFCTASK